MLLGCLAMSHIYLGLIRRGSSLELHLSLCPRTYSTCKTMELRGKVEAIFENVATFVSKNPWKTIFLVLMLQTLFALGLLSLQLDNNIKKMYTARRSVTTRNIDELLPRYPDTSSHEFDPVRSVKTPLYADVVFLDKNETNQKGQQNDIRMLVSFIRAISIDVGFPEQFTLTNVCAQRNNKCVIAGSDISFLSDEFETDFLDESYSPGQVVKIRFYLRQDTDRLHDDSVRWLHAFVSSMTDHKHLTNQSYVFSHSESFLEEIDNDTYPDIPYVSFMFTVFIFYYGFLISGGDCVSKRVHIGRMGVVVTGLGVMGSWGFLSGCGKTFTNMVGIMPYFALYFEVNMLLELLSAVSNNIQEEDPVLRVTRAVKEKGVTCTIVLLAHIIPFSTVIYSSYRAMMTFAIFTVLTLVFVFVSHFTFFVACLAIHERRINAHRHCCTCHVLHPSDSPTVQDSHTCYQRCCTGRKPATKKQLESCFERIARKLFSKTILVTPLKLLFLFMFLCYLGTSIWKTARTDLDVLPEDAITTSSYYSDFHRVNHDHFRPQPPFMFVVNGPVDLTAKETVEYYVNLFDEIKHLSFMNDTMASFWLYDLYNHHNMKEHFSSSVFSTASIKEFITNQSQYSQDIEWGPDNTTILSFRFYVYSSVISDSKSAISVRRQLDQFVKSIDCEMTVHSPSLWLVDSYRTPLYEMIRFVSTEVAVVVVSFIVLGNHVISTVHVLAWHVSFVMGLLGSLVWLDVSINPITMIMIMLGCGYNMEVIIYTLTRYLNTEGFTPASRTFNVLETTTPILFNTTFGMFCGLMVLFVEKSYVFISVLKILATSTALACIHATIFIPVILSIVGAGRSLYFRDSNQAGSLSVWATSSLQYKVNITSQRQDQKEKSAFSNSAFVNDEKTYDSCHL